MRVSGIYRLTECGFIVVHAMIAERPEKGRQQSNLFFGKGWQRLISVANSAWTNTKALLHELEPQLREDERVLDILDKIPPVCQVEFNEQVDLVDGFPQPPGWT